VSKNNTKYSYTISYTGAAFTVDEVILQLTSFNNISLQMHNKQL